jgi:NADH-quinone oxidoreductase subunit N
MTSLLLFLPELVLSAGLVALLCLTLASRETAAKLSPAAAIIAAAAALAASLYTLHASGTAFHGTYRIDALSQGFKAILALAFLFTALFAVRSRAIPDERKTESMVFCSTSLLGMMMMTSAVDILTLYVSLELSSYSLYLLAAMKKDAKSAEASVKYYLIGAATSGFLLWGLSLVAGLAGTTSLAAIAAAAPALLQQPAFILGLFFVGAALLFKLSGFPMHFWAPDVYQGAATPLVNFIATASKAAAIAVFIRLFLWTGVPDKFVPLWGILAFVSMTLGNTVALLQKDAKRLLAYSSIAQAGYLLTGFLAGSMEGWSSSFFYAFAYVLMNTGAFLVLNETARDTGDDNPSASSLNGLAERSPLLALLLLLSLLSLAGIPPLAGFTGKWILFSAAMEKGHWFLVLWGVLNSVVSLFYYLTLVKHAYLEKPATAAPLALTVPVKLLAFFLIAAILGLGLFPAPVITFAREAIALAAF